MDTAEVVVDLGESLANAGAKLLAIDHEESPELGELFGALAKAQGAMGTAVKDALNPHLSTRYADLSATWDACRPALSANGLCCFHRVSGDGTNITITSTLGHSSGQYVLDRLHLLIEPMQSRTGARQPWMQALGSALTYIRRYTTQGLAGVAAGDDDDGEASGAVGPARRSPPPRVQLPPMKIDETAGRSPPAAVSGTTEEGNLPVAAVSADAVPKGLTEAGVDTAQAILLARSRADLQRLKSRVDAAGTDIAAIKTLWFARLREVSIAANGQ